MVPVAADLGRRTPSGVKPAEDACRPRSAPTRAAPEAAVRSPAATASAAPCAVQPAAPTPARHPGSTRPRPAAVADADHAVLPARNGAGHRTPPGRRPAASSGARPRR
ncbi:hypothetical protein G6F46_014131 [Rhizopus delemar]|nr:hypothetical protein G6F46_014131 [Rhizopus delemar]